MLKGEKRISTEMLEKFCAALGIKLSDLEQWTPDSTVSQDISRTDTKTKLVEVFRTLSEETQTVVLRKAKELLALEQSTWVARSVQIFVYEA